MLRGDAYAAENTRLKVDLEKVERAIADYSDTIKYAPEDRQCYLSRARAVRVKALKLSLSDKRQLDSNLDRAISDLDRAVTLSPPEDKDFLASAFEYLGHCYREKGKKSAQKAIENHTKSLEYRPSGFVYSRRALVYEELLGDHERAKADRKKATVLESSPPK